MRAWSLIRTINRCFREPLVDAIRGGSQKGGAKLTQTGTRVLGLYDRLQKQSLQATKPIWNQILKLLK
jgi:molybdate transport system regulatory protein